MNMNEPASQRPLRLWPGVAAAVLLVLIGYVVPIFAPRFAGLGMIGAVVCALIVLLWWLFFSRARWYERLGAIALIIAAAFAEKYVVHPSIAGGAMGNLAYVLAIPTLTVALVAWAVRAAVSHPALALPPWLSPSCSDVYRGSCCGPVASPPTGGRISTGAGRRLPRNSFSRKPPTNRRGSGRPGSRAAPAPAERKPKEPLARENRRACQDGDARSRSAGAARGMAWLSRTRARRRDSRRADRDGLVQSPPVQLWRRADRSGLVVVRRQRRPRSTRRSSAAARRSSPVTG